MLCPPFLAIFGLLGCVGASADSGPAPTLAIVSPADGAVVCGTPLVVVTDIGNFSLTNETIQDAPADLGHMHVYLNGQEAAQAADETVEINDVADAVYDLSADLAHADHSPLDPPVEVAITITVDATVCGG